MNGKCFSHDHGPICKTKEKITKSISDSHVATDLSNGGKINAMRRKCQTGKNR
ncbi:hypothetical protein HanIR_Chr14g0709401 [Helianthus annuus]|nr:hypothetical protein HanIR_Chr14g0709401 [Helianthus annuus]